MGVPELWGVITAFSTVITLVGWVHQYLMYRSLAEQAGVFVCERVMYLAVDGEDRVSVTEPELVLAATVRFWDRAKKHLPGCYFSPGIYKHSVYISSAVLTAGRSTQADWFNASPQSRPECLPPQMLPGIKSPAYG